MTTKTFLLVFITFFCGFMAGAAMMQLKVTKQIEQGYIKPWFSPQIYTSLVPTKRERTPLSIHELVHQHHYGGQMYP